MSHLGVLDLEGCSILEPFMTLQTSGTNTRHCTIISRSSASLVAFFLIGFGVPWAAEITARLKHISNPEIMPALMIAEAFCSVGGAIATYIEGGGLALKQLARRCALYRVPIVWWLYALCLPVGVHIVATLIYVTAQGRFGPITPLEFFHQWWLFYIFAFGMLQGPLGEELGWRGYLLPRLLRRYHPLKASILLGIIWAAWHGDVLFHPLAATALFTAAAVALSILMTVMFLHTRGSVLLAIAMHGMVLPGKEIARAFSPGAAEPPDWLRAVVLIAISLIVIALTRGKLSGQSISQASSRAAS